ncbi:MAG: hypothetical protein J6A59_02050 [Lachnospiraceae bacterium]|nr:hypothetical protein [Lachnospiraceae bacterium]
MRFRFLSYGVDINTTAYFKTPAKDEDGVALVSEGCKQTVATMLANPLSINDIVVKIETYSGTAEEHRTHNGIDGGHTTKPNNLGGYQLTSGRMVLSGETISFTPYIQMRFDNLELTDSTAYVLSEFGGTIIPNDYGELSWNRQYDGGNLTLISPQWSTHADAVKDWGANNVLPGGATLSLQIKKSDRQKVAVTTFQCILEDKEINGEKFFGKRHVENTGGSGLGLTEAQAVSAHQAYVSTVVNSLEATNIQQFVETNPSADDAFGGLEVYANVDISSLGTGASKSSTEDKYYFRNDGDEPASGEGDLDVNDLGTKKLYAGVKTNPTSGGIVFACDDGLSYNMINSRTYIGDKLLEAVEQGAEGEGEGYDNTCNWINEWYNEAFDGVVVIVQQTILEVGYNDPAERTSVLDPKLTPKQASQKSMFSDYFLSQIKTREYSQYYGEDKPGIMGEFKGAQVLLKDMDYLFWSRKFWIPNATTQDLH